MYIESLNNKNRIYLISPNLDKIYTSNITTLSNIYQYGDFKDENNNQLYISNNRFYITQTNVNIDLDFNKLSVNNNTLNIGFQSICRSDSLNLFVAITNNNINQQIATSPDGLTWTLRNTPNNNWTSVSWSNKLNLFVAVANSGTNRIMKSSDGINWYTNNINFFSRKYKLTKGNLAISSNHSLFLLEDGTIYGCGNTSNNYTNIVNTVVENINTATMIAAGSSHSLALLSNGTIKAWGNNTYGKLGNNTTTTSLAPVNVSNINNAIAIAASSDHSLALLSDGTIMSWGYNNTGQLGNSNNTNSSIPVLVSNINNAIAISAGSNFSLALLSDGTIMSWGSNTQGQLGNSNNTNSNIPVNVSNINNAIAISAGSLHSLALLTDGTVKSWGYNISGQLGNGTATNSNIPVTVTGINNAIDISATYLNSYIIDSNNLLKACGSNGTSGSIGNGNNTTTYYSTFQTVSNGNYIVSMAQGSSASHMTFLTYQNVLYGFGYNNNGQLGNYTMTNSLTPVYPVNTSSTNTRFKELIKLNYETNDLSFINNEWISILWNNRLQMFAALSNNANNDNIMTSVDGINWYSRYISGNSSWTHFTIYRDYIYMAYNSNQTTTSSPKLIYSTDGINWHILLNSTNKIFWFDRTFLASGSSSSITIQNGYNDPVFYYNNLIEYVWNQYTTFSKNINNIILIN
jgi:alpha-tubulin suppressor-like RCC1 family protein